jgi:hypothetical protein
VSTLLAFAPEVEGVLALKSSRTPDALQRFQAAIRNAGREEAEFTIDRLRELIALGEHFQALLLFDQVDFLRATGGSEADREYALGVQRVHLDSANGYQRFLRARDAWLPSTEAGEELARIIGLALDSIHGLMKWGLFLGEPTRGAPWRQLHALYALADAEGAARQAFVLHASQPAFRPTAQSLYLRTLVLDLLNSGSLSRIQTEIGDGWFSAWCQDYAVESEYVPGAHHFFVDLEAAAGMRVLRSDPQAGSARYVRADAIKSQIAEVQDALRHGKLFAGYGAGALFPVEEHAALLAIIEKLHRSVLAGNEARVEERTHFEDREVDVACGTERVMRKVRDGAAVTGGPATGATASAQTFELSPSGLSLSAPESQPAGVPLADPELERWRVQDLSSRGYGLIVEHASAESLPVGQLIALLNQETFGWILGNVVRKRPSRVRGEVLAGVEVLAYRPIAVELVSGVPEEAAPALYLPGADSMGKQDSLVVRAADFDSRRPYVIKTPEGAYRIRMNRIIRKGADWINARFEIESKKA